MLHFSVFFCQLCFMLVIDKEEALINKNIYDIGKLAWIGRKKNRWKVAQEVRHWFDEMHFINILHYTLFWIKFSQFYYFFHLCM